MMHYFEHKKITEHIYRIRDIFGVFEYLIVGNDYACLLDTGNGIGNLYEYVRQLTDKDILVILTHGHLDHASGTCGFKHIYMSSRDRAIYENDTTIEYRYANRSLFPNGDQVEKNEYREAVSYEKLIPLTDYKTFDLGGIHIQTIPVPGHTPGMTCALIQEERVILFGDGCGIFVLLLDEYSSTVSEYEKSLHNLKKYEDQYDRIIRNHGTGESPKELLDNVISCCEDVLAGKDAKIAINVMGHELFVANEVMENNDRKDGKQGNLAYRIDKAR